MFNSCPILDEGGTIQLAEKKFRVKKVNRLQMVGERALKMETNPKNDLF